MTQIRHLYMPITYRMPGKPRTHLLLVLALCAIAKLYALWQLHSSGILDYGLIKGTDSEAFWAWAGRILDGTQPLEPFRQGPLYPYGLAALRAIGFGPLGIYVLQVLFTIGSAGLLYYIARQLLSHPASLVAVALYGLNIDGLVYDASLLRASLRANMTIYFVASSLWAWQNPKPWRYGLQALLGGLCTLLSPPFLVLWALTIAIQSYRYRKTRTRQHIALVWGLQIAIYVILMIPALLHNQDIREQYLLDNSRANTGLWSLSTRGPWSFINGNINEERFVGTGWRLDDATAKSILPQAYEDGRYSLWQTAKLTMATHEGNWWGWISTKLWTKTSALVMGYEFPNNVNTYLYKQEAWPLNYWPIVHGWLVPLGWLGLLLCVIQQYRSQATQLVTIQVAGIAGLVIIFYFIGRFRYPALPWLCLGCAYWFGLVFKPGAREQRAGNLVLLLGAAVAMVWISFAHFPASPILSHEYNNYSNILLHRIGSEPENLKGTWSENDARFDNLLSEAYHHYPENPMWQKRQLEWKISTSVEAFQHHKTSANLRPIVELLNNKPEIILDYHMYQNLVTWFQQVDPWRQGLRDTVRHMQTRPQFRTDTIGQNLAKSLGLPPTTAGKPK